MALHARISFRVEAELHAKFMEIAAMQRCPAAQILRQLMRAFVEADRREPCSLQGLIADIVRENLHRPMFGHDTGDGDD